jgi:hypothetical protein
LTLLSGRRTRQCDAKENICNPGTVKAFCGQSVVIAPRRVAPAGISLVGQRRLL